MSRPTVATEYLWKSPGGQYVVPDEWRQRFLAEFPDYRVRWSLKKGCWQLEQQCGRGALPPLRIDEADDSLVRARDGYWLVMEFSPGDRMPCPGVIQNNPRQVCGWPMKVAMRESRESTCSVCRSKGRDGRTMAAHWPFDELLLEHLRFTDPLKGGTIRQRLKADARNAAMLKEAERQQSDFNTSLDYVDYRWISGIASSTGRQRNTINPKDLL